MSQFSVFFFNMLNYILIDIYVVNYFTFRPLSHFILMIYAIITSNSHVFVFSLKQIFFLLLLHDILILIIYLLYH